MSAERSFPIRAKEGNRKQLENASSRATLTPYQGYDYQATPLEISAPEPIDPIYVHVTKPL